jgi:hypothetical protein
MIAAAHDKHTAASSSIATTADFPAVNPDYIYDQLFFMATHFLTRESGYDTNLPAATNGHDEFADYWGKEMMHNLQGFGAQVQRDNFPVNGWHSRPAVVPAFNVEVSVPGASHPEQIVVIGCHYDGEAISTQSANDDASGCAIELGIAKALGDFWRTHHVYPARTLRFVIFDAEEQGLYGSFHYVNNTVNGDTSNIVAMFNEEQSGIAYPLRYLGQAANPLLPFYIDLSPLQNSELYPHQSTLSQAQRDQITRFRALMQQAVPAVFQQFQAMGYQGLTYHNNKHDEVQPIFTPEQMSNIKQEDDTLGGSDQIPFTLAGVPCATFAGNSTYYDHKPPPWSYPFDQRADTIQLMNTFADGSSHKSYALTLALALPGMLTTWMLHQPGVLGETTFSDLPPGPIAAISDIGQAQVGQTLSLDAHATFDPRTSDQSGSSPTYNWNFGDGSQAHGVTVSHTYTTTGTYTLTLTVSSPTGQRRVSKTLTIVTKPATYDNPYDQYPADGKPPANPQVTLPTPDDTLSDKVVGSLAQAGTPPPAILAQSARTATTQNTAWISGSLFLWLAGGIIVMVALLSIAFVVMRRRYK